jgi:hypothetical protein
MTYSEVVALLTSSVHGVRKAVYGVQVREYIARSMEAVIEMVRLGIERMKELASDSKNSADASAKSAAESKQSAAESKASASQSEASANRSEASADASAKSASESAASAAAAKKSETNAKSSEDSAKRYSDKAKDVIAEAKSEYSGGYYKTYDLTALKDSWKKLSPVKGPYQYYCDIAVPDLTERHSPFCSTGLESYAAAVAAGLANAVETRNGALRLFAIRVPTKDIELVLTIFGVGTTSYELTLPVRDWVKMESAIGPNQYYCDVEVPGCLSTMTPLGTTALENFEAASPAGLASMIETCDGHVRFYAVRKPTANIDVIVALIKKEEPVNTPATRDKLGLVKIGDGMNVTSGGSISTRAATDSEFDAMMVRVFGEG